MTPPPNTKNYSPIRGEKWRQAVGFSDRYYVSNKGRIFTTSAHNKKDNPTIMRPARSFNKRTNSFEYYKTVMDGRTVVVHRVVAQTWIPNPASKPFINHKNGDKVDNRVENLEWCSASENTLHAYRTGLEKKQLGEKHHATHLTNEQVKQFKWEWANERKMTRKEYAKELGVSEATIKDIIRGRSWGWLKIT